MKYTGSCHCGVVKFEAQMELGKVIECNCSHCQMKGLLLTFIPAESFTLTSGEENLTLYQFNKKFIEHLFCKTCGVQPLGRGKDKEGKPTVAINVRCLDNVDISTLERIPFDGKNMM